MQKINVTIDLAKLDKSKIETRTYTNREGEEVTVKELKLDVVQVKDPKVVAEGQNWTMMKTHFVAMAQSKEERQAKADTVFVGDGVQFVDAGAAQAPSQQPDQDDSIPF